jgi:hypothetical protein
MKTKTWVICWLIGASLWLPFNYIVDPFLYFRKSVLLNPFYDPGFARYLNAGIVDHIDYQDIIVGSCMTSNFQLSKSKSFLENPCNFSMCAATAWDISFILSRAIKPDTKNILIGLDIPQLRGSINNVVTGFDMPCELYNKNIYSIWRYLTGDKTLKQSVKVLKYTLFHSDHIFFNKDKMYNWYNYHKKKFSKEAVLEVWKNSKKMPKIVLRYDELQKSFDYNILSHIKNNPNIHFYIFLPPYSILKYKQWFNDKTTAESVRKIKQYLYEEGIRQQNLTVYDFQAAETIVTDLNNYRDTWHYSEDVNDWMLEQIRLGHYKVTKDNKDAMMKQFEDMYEKYKDMYE